MNRAIAVLFLFAAFAMGFALGTSMNADRRVTCHVTNDIRFGEDPRFFICDNKEVVTFVKQ